MAKMGKKEFEALEGELKGGGTTESVPGRNKIQHRILDRWCRYLTIALGLHRTVGSRYRALWAGRGWMLVSTLPSITQYTSC